ncbi:MAG: exosome complex protein Rrp42 [Candidatus Thorarchaeota archaeon]
MEIVTEIERERISTLLREGKRIDGRDFDEVRPIQIKQGVITKAEGSAEAWLGKSRILAGIKVQVGTPFPDTPDEGVIIASAELSPMASPIFELGPPGEQAIELARVVDRGIRHSDVIKRTDLCIKAGEQVYLLMLDLYVLADHGNLIDAGSIAAISALLDTSLPKVTVSEEGSVDLDFDNSTPLALGPPPLTVTFAKIDDSIIADPSLEEEQVMDVRLSIAIDGDDTISSMQKYGTSPLSYQEVTDCVERASKIVKKMRKQLPKR